MQNYNPLELQELGLFSVISDDLLDLKHKASGMLSGIDGLEDLHIDDNSVGMALTNEAALVPVLDEHGDTQLVALSLHDINALGFKPSTKSLETLPFMTQSKIHNVELDAIHKRQKEAAQAELLKKEQKIRLQQAKL